MRLILVRHGNTFEPGSLPHCIGSTEDLPLVEKGRAQARQFGQALKDEGIAPTAWYRGPLIRHKQFSEIAIEELQGVSNPIIDERLNEINYGSWSGLTDQEIKNKFSAPVFENWAQRSIYPHDGVSESAEQTPGGSELNDIVQSGAGWKPSLKQLQAEIASFLSDLQARYEGSDTVVAVTSGGRLRFFLQAIPGEFERRSQLQDMKISTGHMCIFNYASGKWSLACWNEEPAQLIWSQ